jgi:hypothetical protein
MRQLHSGLALGSVCRIFHLCIYCNSFSTVIQILRVLLVLQWNLFLFSFGKRKIYLGISFDVNIKISNSFACQFSSLISYNNVFLSWFCELKSQFGILIIYLMTIVHMILLDNVTCWVKVDIWCSYSMTTWYLDHLFNDHCSCESFG